MEKTKVMEVFEWLGIAPKMHRSRKENRRIKQPKEKDRRAATKRHATGRRTPVLRNSVYSKPEERKRETGSATGIGSRLKIQRATAKPNAA